MKACEVDNSILDFVNLDEFFHYFQFFLLFGQISMLEMNVSLLLELIGAIG